MRASKIERLLNLVAFMLDVDQPVTLSEIRGKVVGYSDGAGESTIARRFERDKAELVNLGIPIEYIAPDAMTDGGYFIERSHFFLPAVSLCEEERILLRVVSQLAREVDSEYSQNLFWAIQKLLYNRFEPLEYEPEVTLNGKDTFRKKAKQLSVIQTLAKAAALRAPVSFLYYSIGSNQSRGREVFPYGLGTHKGNWYMAGHSVDAGDVRVFKVGRIESSIKVGEPGSYTVPDDFQINQYIGPITWATEEPRKKEFVTVAFSPVIAWMVQREIEIIKSWTTDDGWCAMRFSSHNRSMLIRWLLTLSPFFRVLEPHELAREFKQRLERIVDIYEDGKATG